MTKRTRIFRANKKKAEQLPPHVKAILAPYFPDFDLDQIRVFFGIPFYVAMNASAFTDGNNLFFQPEAYDPDSIAGIALIGHEIMHSVQYQQQGKWRFRAKYLGNWQRQLQVHRSFDHAYYYNEFEIEARAIEERIYHDLLMLQVERQKT